MINKRQTEALKKRLPSQKTSRRKSFFTGGRATHSKRTDPKKGNDSRFNDNSSADGLRKQTAKLNIMFAPANLILADRPHLAA